MARLRRRLSASTNPFARGLLGLLSADKLDAEAWEDLEATLITADLGVGPTTELIEALRKELAIDGVAPTPENIRNGTYPFVVDLCAVTTGNESENARKLIDWSLSDQGQRLIERCGYVGLQKNTRSSIYFDKPGNDIDNF